MRIRRYPLPSHGPQKDALDGVWKSGDLVKIKYTRVHSETLRP
jgi:hypothetical protein